MGAKLLLIPDALFKGKTLGKATPEYTPIGFAFEHAGKLWDEHPNRVKYQSVSLGDNVKLYSYSLPGCTGHFSPIAIWKRMRLTIKKDSIYLTSDGAVYRPGVEVLLINHEAFGESLLKDYSVRLRKVCYTRSFGTLWDCILKITSVLNTGVRKLYGETVTDFFCSEDKSFYGSLHMRNKKVFISVHGHTKDDVMLGVGILMGVIGGDFFIKKSQD